MQLVMCLLFFADGIVHRNCFTELENTTKEWIPGEKPSPTMHQIWQLFVNFISIFRAVGCIFGELLNNSPLFPVSVFKIIRPDYLGQ